VDESLARWLVGPEGAEALAEASDWPDPSSLAAAQALRRRWAPEQAAVASRQVGLRRRAIAKFGERAETLFFTADGLEQATRAGVARWRARRLASAGADRVVDLGCGIGADALAFADAGLEVVAVELDPATAVLAQANLGERGRVHAGDAVTLATELVEPGDAVFLDPARRTARGRTWRVADVTPPWEWATGMMAGRVGCLKAGPGIAHADLPSEAATAWVSDRGDLVEAGLWSGQPDWPPGSRVVVQLPEGIEWEVERRPEPRLGEVGRYLYEPGPAVIRAGGVPALAEQVAGWALAPSIAYLASDTLVETPLATVFGIDQVLAHDERTLRAWVREAGIGTLEIKLRGLDIDPAVLRRRLKLSGPNSTTVILTPTPGGTRALVARRV
jgi:SAM-dependent methyltransferase